MSERVKTVGVELQPCCGKRTGIGNYTYEMARHLQDDEEIHYCGYLHNFCGRHDFAESLRGIQMPIYESRVIPNRVYQRIGHLLPFRYEQLFSVQADLSVFFDCRVPPHVAGKVISTLHDVNYLRNPETYHGTESTDQVTAELLANLARSDRILTVSQFSRSEIIELLHIPEEKISVVHCAPSVSEEKADFDALADRLGLRKPYLLFVGTIEPRKNLVRLIRAFNYLRKREQLVYQLVLAGGNGWKNREIYQEAENSPFHNDILFTGYLTNAERNTLYENASVFVFPSIYEGFGIPPLEAMHFGCPVVTTNAASLPEVCGDAAVLVDPLDEESIAEGIWKVLSDEVYAEDLRRKGFRQEKRFSWENSAAKLRAICSEVLNS